VREKEKVLREKLRQRVRVRKGEGQVSGEREG